MTERYPSDIELEKIEKWKIESPEDCRGLLDFVDSIWAFRDWGSHKTKRRYYLSTGGWSGNESIISAMMNNRFFWFFSWVESRRGGHYIFEIMRLSVKPISK